MAANYLLKHIRRDGMATVLFCLMFGCVGMLAQWALPGPDNASLRFAGLAATGMSALGLAVAAGPVLHPRRHSTIRELERYGPLEQVLAELQQDGLQATRHGRLRLGSRWLTGCGVGVTVVRRDEIAGLQLAETEIRSNGVKLGSNWRLVVTTRDGRELDFNCRNRETALLLQAQLS
ncbi:hypothetical protein JST97_15155 [bacterium]|nr:hypothetical protein [bacterium]